MDAMFKKFIVKFRVICHRLAIETGRHLKPPLSIESRICVHCPGELVYDELHLITVREYYEGKRIRLYEIGKRYIAEFESLDNQAKFVAILGNFNPTSHNRFGEFSTYPISYVCIRPWIAIQMCVCGYVLSRLSSRRPSACDFIVSWF